jgi:hypothetical protein
MVRLAEPHEEAPTIRKFLHDCARPARINGEELTAEVAHWGRLADGMEGARPTLDDYAEQFSCTPEVAESRLVEFMQLTGCEPLEFHRVQWEAAERQGAKSLLDDVRVVVTGSATR